MAINVAFWCFVRAVTKLRSHSHVVSGLGSTWTNTIIISNCCPVVECLWCLHTLSPAICWKSARSYETSDHIVMNVPLSEILIWICPVQEDFFIQSDDVLSPLTLNFHMRFGYLRRVTASRIWSVARGLVAFILQNGPWKEPQVVTIISKRTRSQIVLACCYFWFSVFSGYLGIGIFQLDMA